MAAGSGPTSALNNPSSTLADEDQHSIEFAYFFAMLYTTYPTTDLALSDISLKRTYEEDISMTVHIKQDERRNVKYRQSRGTQNTGHDATCNQ